MTSETSQKHVLTRSSGEYPKTYEHIARVFDVIYLEHCNGLVPDNRLKTGARG